MKVGLYIPFFNAEKYIKDTLQSVFKQTQTPLDIVLVDDSSIDKTAQIVSQYPVRRIKHVNNKGLAVARNSAIKNMETEFIASLDADCAAEPDWLECLMQRFDSPEVAGVGGKLVEKHTKAAYDKWRSVHMKQHWEEKEDSPVFLCGSNTVFRRQALLDVGLYNEHFRHNYEDVDISERLRAKGYRLVYEPKAIVYHLKRDDLYSLLNNYWNWNLPYYQKKEFYLNYKNFADKLEDNIGLANRYITEDIAAQRNELVYLDFLLGLHHCLKDFEYYIARSNTRFLKHSKTSAWLSLIDLTFFYHFDADKKKISTFMPKANAYLQNFLALLLVISKAIRSKFKSEKFQDILCKHLLQSVYNMDNDYLAKKVLILTRKHHDWSQLWKKDHPHLDELFLKKVFNSLNRWLKSLMHDKPQMIRAIELSAEKMYEEYF